MQVIPAINVSSLEEARALLQKADGFLAEGSWVHIDIHQHTAYSELLMADSKKFSIEAHCMVADWKLCADAWRAAGARRIIVPARHMRAADEIQKDMMLSLEPQDAPDMLEPYKNHCAQFQILAVEPGASGQKFQESAMEKIRAVRRMAPHAMIEVDGGITLDTGRRVLEAGADVIISSSYIWGSKDAGKAYQNLIKM